MSPQNIGLCNECRSRVPAEFYFPDGQVWIRKSCPACGPSESLVSSDAMDWSAKRDLWSGVPTDPGACTMHCDRCRADHNPSMIFLDVTNRCNMSCPICGFSLRGMGFDFNPPLEYFEKVFAAIARMRPVPKVNLFGGEPTVRKDLLEIIETARRHCLHVYITTNGLRLADEEYCRKLCEKGIPLRLAFDGRDREIYQRLRGDGRVYDKKLKAIENLKKYSQLRHTIIATAATGINDRHMGDLIQFCHENRGIISDLGLIPLYENWDPGEFDVTVRTTARDVERMVEQSVPGGGVEFIPAGMTHWLRIPRPFFRNGPCSGILMFAGVHPNCESATFLISDGKTYRGVNHFLNRPFGEAAKELADLIQSTEPQLAKLDPNKPLQRLRGVLLCIRTIAPWVLRTINLRRVLGGNPLTALPKLIWRAISRYFTKRFTRRRGPVSYLRVAVLPFEEQHSIDADRLRTCKAGFAYEDVETDRIETIPHCLWYPYRNEMLRKIAEKYGSVSRKTNVAALPRERVS